MRLTIEPEVIPADPKDEPLRKDVKPLAFGEFLQRTRRYHKLTKDGRYDLKDAAGMDSKQDDRD